MISGSAGRSHARYRDSGLLSSAREFSPGTGVRIDLRVLRGRLRLPLKR